MGKVAATGIEKIRSCNPPPLEKMSSRHIGCRNKVRCVIRDKSIRDQFRCVIRDKSIRDQFRCVIRDKSIRDQIWCVIRDKSIRDQIRRLIYWRGIDGKCNDNKLPGSDVRREVMGGKRVVAIIVVYW
jgi:hypothetical protein